MPNFATLLSLISEFRGRMNSTRDEFSQSNSTAYEFLLECFCGVD
jgi:hypothetical protein